MEFLSIRGVEAADYRDKEVEAEVQKALAEIDVLGLHAGMLFLEVIANS